MMASGCGTPACSAAGPLGVRLRYPYGYRMRYTRSIFIGSLVLIFGVYLHPPTYHYLAG
jgi:hypothetical protein